MASRLLFWGVCSAGHRRRSVMGLSDPPPIPVFQASGRVSSGVFNHANYIQVLSSRLSLSSPTGSLLAIPS
ncbi:hypothetical protein BDV19DRAFT_282207 [Aspergillus venezuelensis]